MGDIVELRTYLRLFRRRWLLIVGTTAAALAVAGVYSFTATPVYASQARVFISTSASTSSTASDNAYQGGLAATQRVQSYASLVSEGELAQRVVSSLGLSMSATALSRKISAEVVPNTVLLKVTVDDPSAVRSRAICREVVSQLLSLITEIETPPGSLTPLLKGTVVGPATLPKAPVSPKPLRNLLLGLVAGLMLGVAIAVTREVLDRTMTRSEDVEETLDAPILGGIANDAGTAKNPLVTALGSHSSRLEAFRVLRTNLQFVDIDAASKIFVVTSSVPSEGKSTTAVNVAITMAQAGQRVLLVDGDLRRPQVAAMLGLENEVGVTTVLLGRISLDDALQQHQQSGLAVLTSGTVPPNPSELLQSRAMSELLKILRDDYDVVIIDSPPLLPVTDAALLARQTDGAVIVVRHGKTTRDQLSGARARLEAVDARVLGSVFNRVRSVGSNEGYGYGYGYAPLDADADGRLAEADLSPGPSSRAVAEVLPIRREGRTRREADERRTSAPEALPDTGTADAPRPGRHRS
ncbi:MAG: ywqD 1 [Nocardioidaceae bacterium]|nr:ywqD 1 [Nocardioidaceae bacterium]